MPTLPAGRLLSTLCAKRCALLALQEKLVTIDRIQKTVAAEVLQNQIADLLSKRRSRSVASAPDGYGAGKEALTNHSLPEIGDAFGRDATYFMPVVELSNCVKKATISRRFFEFNQNIVVKVNL